MTEQRGWMEQLVKQPASKSPSWIIKRVNGLRDGAPAPSSSAKTALKGEGLGKTPKT